MNMIAFPPVAAEAVTDPAALRAEVRAFLAAELGPDYGPTLRARSWSGHDPAFSRRLGQQGWLGMTLPRAYGGHERSALDRYVVVEELLAAGAPVAAHWIADRQSAPLILHNGTEAQRQLILPKIAAGECYFCIGMSEPDSGSDLAAARTRAERTESGFRINGTKLWTTYAHEAHYMILLARTGPAEDRHGGLSQFLIDLSTPGITISPILDIAGEHHMNEVSFRDVEVPADALLGQEGEGWKQVMGELAFERSGPDRFLSSFALINALIAQIGTQPDRLEAQVIGRIAAHLMVLRQMSISVAGMLARGENPAQQATIVKDLGALLEQEIPEIARALTDTAPRPGERDTFAAVLAQTILAAPSFSLRGGTRQILRGIIARGLGLR
ncbi:acyl-CoA dehydrogenase family protein [Maritimibacter alkaliphilus]|uniref:acyl-CoA dehydrogenase family protein n=1 Tax=Maritimibacter alkaliphilus TaxID=404236 RepID=UPI001C98E47B|nr:acyl-CoA dehydrogenase family protein [Maritimibacter alkaliphilus]MBY6092343.1 acyl-CoA dehydrogenase family protein [Maritimibacter alkaliphilus]